MKQAKIIEAEGWSFEKRLLLDNAEHKLRCECCRDDEKLKPGELLYGVKNKRTREYLHIVARDTREARVKLGWLTDDVWIMILDGTGSHTVMSEETKQKLKAINKERRSLRRPEAQPKGPPERHTHECPQCGAEYMHSKRNCGNQSRLCLICESEEFNRATVAGGIDTAPAACYDGPSTDNSNANQEGGDIMDATDLKSFTREFIESQVFEKKDGELILDKDKLFNLAKVNGVDASGYKKDFTPANAGRIRMTIGNMIRGAASRNGKLITLNGASKMVPVAFLPVKKVKAEKKAVVKKKAA